MSGSFEEAAIDAELLGQLLASHGGALGLYAAQWVDSPEDCVQEAFVELARQRAMPDHVVGWLYRVVKNRALNAARGVRRRREREEKSIAGRFTIGNQPATFDHAERVGLVEALDTLNGDQREVIVMRVWGGLTYEEIARSQSISVSTAYRKYVEALEKLRESLEPTCSTQIVRKSSN